MSAAVSTEDFLRAVWGTDDKGIAELAVQQKNGFFQAHPFNWGPPESLKSFLFAAKNHNEKSQAHVYFGVLLRGKKWPYPTGRRNIDGTPEQAKRGREDNVISCNCVWAEFDFQNPANAEGHKGRVVLAEDAKRMLAEFPIKPSIVVKSGGGIHVYWILKELALGDDVWKVKGVNKALVAHFTVKKDGKDYGADNQAFDLARTLRLPNTLNWKYTPPRPCEVTFWAPDRRYTLHDFDFLPQEEFKPRTAPAEGYVGAGPTEGGVKPLPKIALDAEIVTKLIELFGKIWIRGQGHAMAMKVAGWFAYTGVRFEDALTVVCGVTDSYGGETNDRRMVVEGSYTRFVNGEEVQGKPSLDKMIEDDVPTMAKDGYKKIVAQIEKLLPQRSNGEGNGGGGGKGAEADFEIVKIIKFDSRPARYVVVIRKLDQDKEVEVPCEIETFTNIKKFRTAFTESTPDNQNIAPIKQWRWEHMFSAAPCELQPAPKESTTGGSIQAKLEGFLDEKKENPELGDLKVFPGYNEKEVYFQLDAFRRRLRDAGVKASDREITHVLRDDGWKDDRRWVGNKNPRLWVKSIIQAGGGGNGNGNGNGHGPAPSSPPKDPLQAPDLFNTPEGPPSSPPPTKLPPSREPGMDVEEAVPEDFPDH